jgi:hypothetical protein
MAVCSVICPLHLQLRQGAVAVAVTVAMGRTVETKCAASSCVKDVCRASALVECCRGGASVQCVVAVRALGRRSAHGAMEQVSKGSGKAF